MPKLLLHICCAPCSITPIEALRDSRFEVMGFFYRSNIHPFTECRRREATLTDYADRIGLKLIIEKGYDLEGFLRRAAFRESDRCLACYHDRLEATARLARRGRFDAFSTTLLYSRYQKHAMIRDVAHAVAHRIGVPFHYSDFRDGWKEGIERSRQMGMYRQPYCGCIYSEKERYYRPGRPAAESQRGQTATKKDSKNSVPEDSALVCP